MFKRIVLELLLLSALRSFAMPIYTCDFESEAERQQWILNPTANAMQAASLKNKWYIDTLTHSGPTGNYALYISADGNKSINYNASNAMFVLAYRPMTIPKGTYGILFDWLANGKPSGSDAISVCFVPDDDLNVQKQLFSSGNSSSVPNWVKQYAIDTVFAHALTWQHAHIKYKSDGRPGKLIFVWANSGGTAKNPPACIDNIEVLDESACAQPYDISHMAVNGVITLTWEGSADSYSIIVQDNTTGKWYGYTTKENKAEISDLEEGMYSFRLRGYCGSDPSPYAEYNPFIVYEGTRCIDYLTLNKAACYTGAAGNINDLGNSMFGQGCVDYGYASIKSRHTIHYLQNEYDPRTMDDEGNSPGLKTVPSDELASVRLGNWETGAQAERIEYKYKVEEGASDILKIRYAVVMQSPAQMHDIGDQSHFKLDILDSYGQPIGTASDRVCNSADFAAGYGEDMGEWYTVNKSGNMVFWKDWTTISVSLRNYIGQTLTIRLSTSDCTQGGHYGYAYFTLACETGEIRGLACGSEPSTHFEAPQGFNYRWYREDQPDIVLSDKYYLDIEPNDTMYYVVDVISKTNENCYYQLVASGIPHNPIARAKYTLSAANCQNIVSFVSDCSVRMFNDQRSASSQEWESTTAKVTDMAWNFGDGTIISTHRDSVTHAYPPQGGKYKVKLYAYLSERLCCDSVEVNLDLPDIRTKDFIVTHHICDGDVWTFNGKEYIDETHDTVRYTSWAGCDSLFVVDVYKHDRTPIDVDTMICGNDMPFLFFNGKDTLSITQSGNYRGEFINRWKCDSIVSLHIQIEPVLAVDMPDTSMVCADGEAFDIPYQLLNGRLDSIYVYMGQSALNVGFEEKYGFCVGEPMIIPLPNDVRPGKYAATIRYVTPLCKAEEQTIYLEVNYPSSVLDQKSHNGWVGVLQNEVDKYHFVRYQWYRDGVPVPGATDPYLPMTDLDVGHSYYVYLIREGETEGIRSCSLVYGVATGINSLLHTTRPYELYTLYGEKIVAPIFKGLYIVRYLDNYDTRKIYIR